ncbi:hypothetical protein M9978_07975 [Sphingomonas sp. MG17]|uniref:Uncharacterized protein n=1 Tax=Sphingomonas tagetis TaxID=2949092 RepID=A0A9X2HR54_9SPHN|nr:hypothetical protein [Sphingomonas tagetis]MCP3730365.1 hypothetical protein [Sphingomonas tagetis]
MIEDREVWACANMLIKQHGGDAWLVVSQRADELLEQGEIEGHRTFLRILRRIEDLERTGPVGSLH